MLRTNPGGGPFRRELIPQAARWVDQISPSQSHERSVPNEMPNRHEFVGDILLFFASHQESSP
jgi:hypothetical protein